MPSTAPPASCWARWFSCSSSRAGGDGLPPADAGWRRPFAAIVHWGLIATLLGQAATGVVAVYLAPQAARAHALLWSVLLALHAMGVLFHLLRRDGVAGRVLPLGRRRREGA